MLLTALLRQIRAFSLPLRSTSYIALVTLTLAGCNATTPQKAQHEDLGNTKQTASIDNISSKQKPDDNGASTSPAQQNSDAQATTTIDLWERIHQRYELSQGDITAKGQQRIESYLKRYARYPNNILRQTERAGLYLYYVVEELEKNNIPAELALLPFVESSYDPFAYSSGRASGLWQFIPGTGRRFKLKESWWLDERRDVVASTQAAIRYFKYLNNFFDGDWLLAIAAYNAGEGTVRKAIKKNRRKGLPTDYWSLPLPRETKNYIPKLFAWVEMVKNPEKYQLTLAKLDNKPHFTVIDVGSQIDLATFAEISNIDIDTVYALNPAYNRWATDPDAPHLLLVPVHKSHSATKALASYPVDQHIRWQRYTIKPNDSLGRIAQQYGTTISALKSVNQLKTSRIRVGKSLLIPQASKELHYYSHSAKQRLKKRQDTSGKKSQHRIVHIVQSGDTLWSIARHYQVSANRLAHWNNMSPRDVLKVKQELVVWANSPAASTQQPPRDRANGIVRKVSYRVRSGDSLSAIANKFNVTISDIRKWNDINQSKLIHPGQILKLLVSVADQSERF